MMTMPSYFGFEGINPLTVYFVYNEMDKFSMVVLEVWLIFSRVVLLTPIRYTTLLVNLMCTSLS
jgi:DUF1365 family protein